MSYSSRLIDPGRDNKFPLLRPLLRPSKSGLISLMVLLLITEYSKCSRVSNIFLPNVSLYAFFFLKLRGMSNYKDPYLNAFKRAACP